MPLPISALIVAILRSFSDSLSSRDQTSRQTARHRLNEQILGQTRPVHRVLQFVSLDFTSINREKAIFPIIFNVFQMLHRFQIISRNNKVDISILLHMVGVGRLRQR